MISRFLPRATKQLIKQRIAQSLHFPFPIDGVPAPLVKHLQRGRALNLIDVGAHEGLFTATIEQYCGIRAALLCEPIPERVKSLGERFKPPKYLVYGGIISSHEGMTSFNLYDFDATSSLLAMKQDMKELSAVSSSARRIEAPCSRLDSVVPEVGFEDIDLLKIDVQGAESLVLQGAEATLRRTRMIWIELSFRALYHGSALFSEVYSALDGKGFALQELDPAFRSPAGELLQVDALFIRRST